LGEISPNQPALRAPLPALAVIPESLTLEIRRSPRQYVDIRCQSTGVGVWPSSGPASGIARDVLKISGGINQKISGKPLRGRSQPFFAGFSGPLSLWLRPDTLPGWGPTPFWGISPQAWVTIPQSWPSGPGGVEVVPGRGLSAAGENNRGRGNDSPFRGKLWFFCNNFPGRCGTLTTNFPDPEEVRFYD
jgi:hypothetical protein